MRNKARWVVVAATAVGTLALAGCGAASNTSSNTSAVGNSTGSAQNATANSTVNTQTVTYPLTVTDQAGHKVTISKPPTHIASGTEGTDEILVGLVPKSEIAMVTSLASSPVYSNVSTQVAGIPELVHANAEQILKVHPDLVLLASYTTPGVVSQVEQAGVPVYEFANFNTIGEIEQNIKILGKLVDEPAKAAAMVEMMQQKIQAVELAVKGHAKPTVLDYGSSGYAAGSGTTANDIIIDAGGINAGASLNGWQQVTTEEVVKMNPAVIIDTSDDAGFSKKLESDPAFASVTAVKDHHIYLLSPADLSSVSQYIYKAVQDVAKVIHPSVTIAQ